VSDPLILALPSKGRLKDQTAAWLADSGLELRLGGGARGYSASLASLDGLEARLISAADIALALRSGEAHLGVTGADLLGETGGAEPLLALAFGRADLVVAAPRSWIDVETMADVADVAHDVLARTGRRLRVATKYTTQTRAFFASHGIADYRIVESSGATEGAPAAGTAELVVDITTTGATLAANGLRALADGVILKSQAHLAASLTAPWTAAHLACARRLLAGLEARARGHAATQLAWFADQARAVETVLKRFEHRPLASGALIARADVRTITEALAAAGVGPVAASHPTYVFDSACVAADRLEALVKR
jgi:ATP phosphoribosyltransferase